MPKPKKASAAWYIAATHFLTAAFLIPLAGGLVFGLLMQNVVIDPLIDKAISLAVMLALIYVGVRYSSRYLARTYMIPDPDRIVLLSTVYMVVLWLGFSTLILITYSPHTSLEPVGLALGYGTRIIEIIVFYLLSKHMVKGSV